MTDPDRAVIDQEAGYVVLSINLKSLGYMTEAGRSLRCEPSRDPADRPF